MKINVQCHFEDTIMEKTNFTKLRTKVLGIIEGMTMLDERYFTLRKAILFAEQVHCNLRKDGSPEFSHQLEMLAFAFTMHTLLIKPFEVYISIVLHDLYEDYPQHLEYIRENFPDFEQYAIRLSKFKDASEKQYKSYFKAIGECDVCSVVKSIDRYHNLSTAPGVFSTQKIMEYCDEVEMYFLPMLRAAKQLHNQRAVYELMKSVLSTQIKTIDTFLKEKSA